MSKNTKIIALAALVVVLGLILKATFGAGDGQSDEQRDAQHQELAAQAVTSSLEGPSSVEVQTHSVWDAKLPGRGIGNPDAPIKMIEFSSLGCSHCAGFHEGTLRVLKEKYIDTGALYLEFVEFPLNRPALDASKALRCVDTKQYYNFMNILFQTQNEWAFTNEFQTVLKQKVALAGVSNEEFDACMGDQNLEDNIAANVKAASEKFDIRSTPSFVINNGERILSGNLGIAVFDEAFSQIIPKNAVTPEASE